jgi:RNA polymerase sigma-70 factor (ECF subfamily)
MKYWTTPCWWYGPRPPHSTAVHAYRPGSSQSRTTRHSKALKREGRTHQGLLPASFLEFADPPESELIERESRMAVRRLVSELSEEQRTVVELTYYHGWGYKEIAQVTGSPVNTVKTRMFHARRKLKANLVSVEE